MAFGGVAQHLAALVKSGNPRPEVHSTVRLPEVNLSLCSLVCTMLGERAFDTSLRDGPLRVGELGRRLIARPKDEACIGPGSFQLATSADQCVGVARNSSCPAWKQLLDISRLTLPCEHEPFLLPLNFSCYIDFKAPRPLEITGTPVGCVEIWEFVAAVRWSSLKRTRTRIWKVGCQEIHGVPTYVHSAN